MGITERNAVVYKVVRSICGIRKAVLCAGFHHIFAECHRRYHTCEEQEAAFHGVDGIKSQLFVFLKVLIVCQRDSLHDGQHGHQGTIDTAGLSTNQLRDIRILFLRHNAASGAVRIIHLNKTVLVAVPDDDLLGETA